MKLFRLALVSLMTFLTLSASPVKATVPEIYAGLTEAVVGINPLTGLPSGWYISEVTLHILAPADTLADGKLLQGGQLTISEEGQHQVEFQPGPFGQANTITQLIWIDKTPPLVTWLAEPNLAVSGYGTLSAEITDATSGLCSLETSLDHGRSWERQFGALSDLPPVHDTTWSAQWDFQDFREGGQVVLLRAWDCAGNASPGEILVVQVKK